MQCGAELGHDRLDLCRQLAEYQLFELYFLAGIVYINPDEVPAGIVIEHDPFRDLLTFRARLLCRYPVSYLLVDGPSWSLPSLSRWALHCFRLGNNSLH